jgi:DNA-binding transcriptional regulator YdaS (Cro superfamily)
MDKLIAYIKSEYSSPEDRERFCEKCGTTWGYLKKARSIKQNLRESVCINFERESAGAVRCEELRPDVDWAYLRGTKAVA